MSDPIPHSIKVIANILKDYVPPEGSFEPASDWDLTFTMWVPIKLVGADWIAGSLSLSRRSTAGGFDLSIKQVSRRVGRGDREERLEARVSCASDKTATPLRWTLSTEIFDSAGKAAPHTRGAIRGESRPGQFQVTRSSARTHSTGKALTDRWTVMEAVQRLPFEPGTTRFDFLEDLEALKQGHRLDYAGVTDVELPRCRIKLHSFEQIGPGVLPITYWLDENHRLLFAVGGIRAYILDGKEKANEPKA